MCHALRLNLSDPPILSPMPLPLGQVTPNWDFEFHMNLHTSNTLVSNVRVDRE